MKPVVLAGAVVCSCFLSCVSTRPIKASYSPTPAGLAVIPPNLADNDSVQSIPAPEFGALAISIALIRDGKVVASGAVPLNDTYKKADLGAVPLGKYRLRVNAKCHAAREEEVSVEEDRPELSWRLPAVDEMRFISEPTEVRRVNRAGQNEGVARMPKGTAVRVLHRLPDQNGGCTSALAEAVGSPPAGVGGRFIVTEVDESLVERNPAEVEAEQKGREAAAAEKAAQQKQREEAKAAEQRKREEDLAVAAAEEAKSGRCRQDRYRLLQAAVEVTGRFFTDYLAVEDQSMAVASEKGTPVQLTAGLGGKYHVFAFGVERVALSAKDRQGYEVAFTSQYQSTPPNFYSVLGTHVFTASRVVPQVETRATITATVKGRGCVALVAFRE